MQSAELLNKYINVFLRNKGTSEETISNYKYRILDFLDFCKSQRTKDIVSNTEKYAKLLIHTKSPKSAYIYFSTILNFLEFCCLKEFDDKERLHRVLGSLYTIAKQSSGGKDVMSEKERNRLYEVVETLLNSNDYLNIRNALIVLLYESLGLRIKDILRSKLSDFHLLKVPKCGECLCYEKDTIFYCSDNKLLKKAYKKAQDIMDDNDLIAVSQNGGTLSRVRISQIIKSILEQAGIESSISPRKDIIVVS